MTNDYPQLTTYLSKTVVSLINLQSINMADIVWYEQNASSPEKVSEEDEDLIFVESYFQLMAEILLLIYQKSKSKTQIVDFFFKNRLNETFAALKPKLTYEGLFDEIAQNFQGEGYDDLVRPLLEGDQDKIQAIQD